MNYYYELKGDRAFRTEYDITDPSDISLGGIIIGCHRTKVSGTDTDAVKNRRYNVAKRVRDQLYEGKLKLRTWDEVCSFIGGQTRENVTR